MNEEIVTIELTEQSLESLIYEIRDQKIILDFDLARIYGYTTKAFNQQVKNNIEKFPEDFMFQLTNAELEIVLRCQNVTTNTNLRSKKSATNSNLRSKKLTANELSSKRRYNPYAFTEQGIYMLMTVLKGELAIKQSKALIRLFKRMKDYIVENKELIGYNASLINDKFLSYDKKFIEVDEKLKIVMDNFIDPSTYKQFLILDGQKIEADLAYQTIYSLAKQSIYIIDDYIGVKTLHLLMAASKDVKVIIISDNASRNPVQPEYIEEFKEETGINLVVKPSNNRCHDRLIVIDYETDKEKIYICGSSSKDTGNKITTILEINKEIINHSLIDSLLD